MPLQSPVRREESSDAKQTTATWERYAGATFAGRTMKPTAAVPAQIISSPAMAGRCHGAVQAPETIRSGGHHESSRLEPPMPISSVPSHTAKAVTGTRIQRTAVTASSLLLGGSAWRGISRRIPLAY
jgi:hypothetical protein